MDLQILLFFIAAYASSDYCEARNCKAGFQDLVAPYASSPCDQDAADAYCQASIPGELVPDPKDCHNYYLCVSVSGNTVASASPLACPDGEYFNAVTSKCEAEDVVCLPLCQNQCTLTCQNDLDIVANPDDCGGYFICTPGPILSPGYCLPEVPYFNGVNCTNVATDCCDFCTPFCNDVGIQIPDPYDCSKFYACAKTGAPSEETHLECPPNQQFDYTLGDCSPTSTCLKTLCSKASTAVTETTTATDYSRDTTEEISLTPIETTQTTTAADYTRDTTEEITLTPIETTQTEWSELKGANV